MDKLEPIIRHKFWIIFGLTLPIALFAYFSTSGKMAKATSDQEAKLEGALTGVPQGDSEPNQTYADGAKLINEDLQKRFDSQVQGLWEMQTERMTWPKIVVEFIPDTYRGEIPSNARYTYMRVYPSVIERVWERIQPYVGDAKVTSAGPMGRNVRPVAQFKAEWPQKVIIDGHKIPHASFDMSAPAANKDIWDAQEDIWLLELIFDAVVRTNTDAQFVSDAPVRRIDTIELVGGSGESSVTAGATGGMGAGDMGMAMDGGMEEMYSDFGGGGGGTGMGGGGNRALGGAVKVGFDVAEEFGAQIPEASDDLADASASPGMGMDMGMEEGMFGGGMYGARAGAKMQRYIGESGFDPFEGAYRERGFYMSVIILQDRIPDFLAELSSSPWPIRIGRFQIGENPYAAKTPTQGGGGYGMAFGGGFGGGEYDSFGGGAGGFGNYDDEMAGGFGGGFGGMGGRGGMATLKLPDYMKLPTSIPPELLSHPDLVQMDFCGIITMYNPVTDDSVEVTDDGSTEEDFEEQLEQSPETPEEAQAMAAEAAAAAASEAATPAAGTAPGAAPANGALPPGTPAGSETPPAADAPVESPTPEPESAAPADAVPPPSN